MATHRNRYVKVHLFEESHTHLQDARVVGQGADYLLLERPQPKERAKAATPRKPRAKKPATQPSSGSQVGQVANG